MISSSVRALFAASVMLAVPLACSSKTATVTSGGGHFEIVSDSAVTDPTLKCDDIGKQVTISVKDSTGTDKLIVDGDNGATVQCEYDGTHYSIVVANAAGSISASGHFGDLSACPPASGAGACSSDGNVIVAFTGTRYTTPSAQKCTIAFVCNGTPCPDGNTLEGHFVCSEVDNPDTSKECAITGANPGGLSNSYFKFADCVGF